MTDESPTSLSRVNCERAARSSLMVLTTSRRKVIAVCYLLVVVSTSFCVFLFTGDIIPETLSRIGRYPYTDFALEEALNDGLSREWADGGPSVSGWLLANLFFFASQGLLIWGGGKIRIDGVPARLRARVVPFVVFSFVSFLIMESTLMGVMQYGDRMRPAGDKATVFSAENTEPEVEMPSPGSVAPLPTSLDDANVQESGLDDGEEKFRAIFEVASFLVDVFRVAPHAYSIAMLSSWLCWIAIGAFYVRGTDTFGCADSLVRTLISGSWIQFCLVLPVEVATRPREAECPCSSGSFIGLMLMVPLILWSIGPAVVLLFVKEYMLCRHHDGYAKLVLARKSVKSASEE